MKMASELVVGEILLNTKDFLTPNVLNCFGSLIFQMNAITGPGTYNTGVGAAFNELPLTNTTAMPNYMGSAAQAGRYNFALPTFSSISLTLSVDCPDFYRTGSTGATAVYDATYDDTFFFCLIPFNSGFNTEAGVGSLQLMPWAQAIRQPGARRLALHTRRGRASGTLRASTSIGKIEGSPSWETDEAYRSSSEDGQWSEPAKGPFWMLMAYYPYGEWGEAQPSFEITAKLGMHATFFQPKIATLYTALEPSETKMRVSESEVPLGEEKEEADDDDPSLLDMEAFKISERPVLVRSPAIAGSLAARSPAPAKRSASAPRTPGL